MKEIIDILLRAEQQAKQIVDGANKEAAEISARTDQTVAVRRTEIVNTARDDARRLIEESKQAAIDHKESQLTKLEEETDNLFDTKKQAVPAIIKKIIRQITTVEK
ncbi:MAG: hypothetical protein RBU23_02120 [Candidatus Auribacterota bacterium]|nr:hypothetical protein [Candidatus Auribacterota bacterium]